MKIVYNIYVGRCFFHSFTPVPTRSLISRPTDLLRIKYLREILGTFLFLCIYITLDVWYILTVRRIKKC